ncbi:MAG: DNA replication/repair protein RecF, partial [Thermostichales cyanobacterium SZTDM-1c_bins_54]
QQLQLQDFRNYRQQEVIFSALKTILVGDNAQGKSNLLEAVELLSSLSSHRASRERELIHRDRDQAWIRATIRRWDVERQVGILLRNGGRKSLQVNGQTLNRHLDFLGQLNAVLFSSWDLEIVRGNPEYRRSWLDRVLIQLEPVYGQIREDYARTLRQRNALLKSESRDPEVLLVWNQALIKTGMRVMRRRQRLIQRLQPLAQTWHHQISGGQEELTLSYQSQVPCPPTDATDAWIAAFQEQLQRLAKAESQRGTSLVGPHRDEVDLYLNGIPARLYGSQGQQRTLVLALKLAELHLIEEVIGEPPLLLLDDVLAELDLHRQNQLLDAIQNRIQTVVTATHLNAFAAPWLGSAQIYHVHQGSLRL